MPKKAVEKLVEEKPQEEKKEEKKKTSQQEFEKRVVELAEKGLTSEKIGETLRKEGIHPKDYSKKISKVIKEKKIYSNPDLKNAEDKLSRIKKHCQTNKQDKRAIRESERIFAKLRILKKHFQA